jgi:hypothetical protein
MPPRPKKNKHRAAAGLFEWECVFSSEFDMFGDLKDAGVSVDESGRPDIEEARAAWQRYGAEFLADFATECPRGAHFVPWGLEQFGEPTCR